RDLATARDGKASEFAARAPSVAEEWLLLRAWTMRLCYMAAVAAAFHLAACGRWPAVSAMGDVHFMDRGGGVSSVDILPIDVTVATYPEADTTAQELAPRVVGAIRDATVATLANRGYRLGAAIDWDGSCHLPDGTRVTAMTTDELVGTADAF